MRKALNLPILVHVMLKRGNSCFSGVTAKKPRNLRILTQRKAFGTKFEEAWRYDKTPCDQRKQCCSVQEAHGCVAGRTITLQSQMSCAVRHTIVRQASALIPWDAWLPVCRRTTVHRPLPKFMTLIRFSNLVRDMESLTLRACMRGEFRFYFLSTLHSNVV